MAGHGVRAPALGLVLVQSLEGPRGGRVHHLPGKLILATLAECFPNVHPKVLPASLWPLFLAAARGVSSSLLPCEFVDSCKIPSQLAFAEAAEMQVLQSLPVGSNLQAHNHASGPLGRLQVICIPRAVPCGAAPRPGRRAPAVVCPALHRGEVSPPCTCS